MAGPDVSQALEGYFEEVAELVRTAQGALLSVETSVAEGDLDVPNLYTLYRAMHTVKGLSAMVEAKALVRLAHGLETVLQGLHAREEAPSRELLDRLFEGLALLERLVDRFRAGEVESDEVDPLLEAVQRARASEPAAGGGPGGGDEDLGLPRELLAKLSGYERRKTRKRVEAGEGLYLLELVPDKDKVARGVGINAVRGALEERGELVGAVPVAEAGKGLKFVVAAVSARPLDEVLSAWGGDVTGTVLRPPKGRPAPPPPAAGREQGAPKPRETIRVPAERLDEMLRLVGELVVAKSRIWGALPRLEDLPPRRFRNLLEERLRGLDRAVRDLRDTVTQARLVTAAELLQRVPLIAREAARVQGKEVRTVLEGTEVEVDKAVVERLAEPLVHLVRNAVDHGIEPPADRERAGKPPMGTLRVGCRARGEEVVVEVSDDGRGVDPRAVRPKAEEMGLVEPGGELRAEDLVRVLCAPGFTTHRTADELGGRGVGMEAVWHGVHALGGRLGLETRSGRGTTWTLAVPLTLTIAEVVLARVGPQTLAVPLAAVAEVLEARPLVRIEGNCLLHYRGREIPHLDLAEALGIPTQGEPPFPAVIVVEGPAGPVGLGVGRMVGVREVVLKPLVDPLLRVPGVQAVTDLGDGRSILVLDPRRVVESAGGGPGRPPAAGSRRRPPP